MGGWKGRRIEGSIIWGFYIKDEDTPKGGNGFEDAPPPLGKEFLFYLSGYGMAKLSLNIPHIRFCSR